MNAITISVAAIIISILSFIYAVYTGAIECYFKTIHRKQTASYKLFKAGFILNNFIQNKSNISYLSNLPKEHSQILKKTIEVTTNILDTRKKLNKLNPLVCFFVPFLKIKSASTIIELEVQGDEIYMVAKECVSLLENKEYKQSDTLLDGLNCLLTGSNTQFTQTET